MPYRAATMCISVAAFLMSVPPAVGQVVYQRLPTHCCGYGVGPIITTATAFSVSAPTQVSKIGWWGGYAAPEIPTDDFTITIYQDDAGHPGAPIATYQRAAVTRVLTGNWVQPPNNADPDFPFPGVPEYLYTFTLPTPVSLSAGSISWLGLYNVTSTTATHLWEMSITGDSGLVVFGSGGNWGTPNNTVELPAFWLEAGNTDTGADISVTPSVTLPDGTTSSMSLSFDNVEGAGTTTVAATAAGPSAPTGFKLTNPPVYYEITTTATFTGNVRVCLNWVEGHITNESNVKMFHYEGNQWVDITDASSVDSVNNTVCGTTTSFSAFTLMEVKYPFTGFFQPVDNLPTVNAVKAGAAVPVKFSLGGDLGLDIFASTYPQTKLMQCETGEPIAAVEETVNAGGSSLSYDATTGFYTYVWKTQKAWGNSCRELQVELNDGEIYTARFTLRK